MNALPAVAVLGLGAMGHAFAANLLKKASRYTAGTARRDAATTWSPKVWFSVKPPLRR